MDSCSLLLIAYMDRLIAEAEATTPAHEVVEAYNRGLIAGYRSARAFACGALGIASAPEERTAAQAGAIAAAARYLP